ncbi:hypothetical protein [Sulfuracidifex metallicus]|uniref:hypothetical protein n=1 Tax=Sulfuracidifex metallicus TaxID=47303 RepID=UPI0006D0CE05|nr:hypothetical protein [Sulfuracidifex metallicus]
MLVKKLFIADNKSDMTVKIDNLKMESKNILTQVQLPINIDPEKIFEINSRIIFNEDFRNKILEKPNILSQYLVISQELIKDVNVQLPPTASSEFKKILINAANEFSKEGTLKAEEFEYNIQDAQNYLELVAAVVLAVAVVLFLWVY